MARAEQFSENLKAYAKAVETGLAQATGQYSLQFYTALINAKHTGPNNPNPVLTGYSRSRWRLRFRESLPDVSPPKKDHNKRYPMPEVPSRTFKKLQSSVITNDAFYINEIDNANLIVRQAELHTHGLLDKLIKRHVPR